MKIETRYLAIFGMSIALFMATVLFVMVGINPKKESYQLLPWLYSSLTGVGSASLWIWSKSLERQIEIRESLASQETNQ
ncbi:MAG: hypothetical protein VX768_09675 [Planctomycetota bacterium]|nr:hypothetical protein [Planctomycetota bacterium]